MMKTNIVQGIANQHLFHSSAIFWYIWVKESPGPIEKEAVMLFDISRSYAGFLNLDSEGSETEI